MIKGLSGKPFTLDNLRADKACEPGLAFVTPIIERGGDVALELRMAGYVDWLSWAIEQGYDCSSAWRDMDEGGNSFTWGEHGIIYATAGDYGAATAGYRGTATAGYGGTATAGYRGTATAGEGGVIVILHWDSERGDHLRCAEVDGVTIKANTPYRLNEKGEFVEVER